METFSSHLTDLATRPGWYVPIKSAKEKRPGAGAAARILVHDPRKARMRLRDEVFRNGPVEIDGLGRVAWRGRTPPYGPLAGADLIGEGPEGETVLVRLDPAEWRQWPGGEAAITAARNLAAAGGAAGRCGLSSRRRLVLAARSRFWRYVRASFRPAGKRDPWSALKVVADRWEALLEEIRETLRARAEDPWFAGFTIADTGAGPNAAWAWTTV